MTLCRIRELRRAAVGKLFENFVDNLTTFPDAGAIWEHTAGFAQELGFSTCSLTMACRSGNGLQSSYFRSGLSEEFDRAYLDEGLVNYDPFLLFSCNSLSAKKVGTEDLSCFKGASAMHQMFLDQVADAGASNGIAIPVRTSREEHFGGWLFSSNDKRDMFDFLNQVHGREIHLAGVLAYERLAATGFGHGANNRLSARERECLLWLCRGLRVSRIAAKLSIGDSAVNLYISNAKRKLGARTREQAIARAIFSGEISL